MNSSIIQFKEVNDIIKLLLTQVKDILGNQFMGMYIHGSLAIGDFNPKSSDIDFLVVTKDIVSNELFDSLEKMHKYILTLDNTWANKLEGSYVSNQLLISKEPPKELRPYINEGKFYLEQYGQEWILELYTIREYGIIIEGPNPKILIPPISSKELKKASVNLLNNWWVPMLTNTSICRLKESYYQTYTILTMCRTLYMFEHGTIVSKKKATEWALKFLDDRWKVLIERAVHWEESFAFENIEEIKEFIRFTRATIVTKSFKEV